MTSNITTQSSSFLPTTTYYPEEPDQFRIQLTTFSQQVANRVNLRTIGVHESVILIPGISPQPNQAVVLQTGESWQSANLNLPNNRRQPFRAVFYATPNNGSGTTTFDTGLDFSNAEFTKMYATMNFGVSGTTILNYNDGTSIVSFFIDGNIIKVFKNNTAFDNATITFILEYMQAS